MENATSGSAMEVPTSSDLTLRSGSGGNSAAAATRDEVPTKLNFSAARIYVWDGVKLCPAFLVTLPLDPELSRWLTAFLTLSLVPPGLILHCPTTNRIGFARQHYLSTFDQALDALVGLAFLTTASKGTFSGLRFSKNGLDTAVLTIPVLKKPSSWKDPAETESRKPLRYSTPSSAATPTAAQCRSKRSGIVSRITQWLASW